ncbi:trichohyalin-like [Tigriopus californicus]|uniref:trichohyalin-like n=1 Tax=Tigriopus californicus TaxID=6832 RepID=UPI0027D9E723|nr:trichohyalin-like [Tigriopus californicus]
MRIEAEAQAQKRKKEAEAARQKAIQEELKKLMEEEEIEKEQMILAEKKKREEEERKLVEHILERRRKAEEEVKAQRRAFEEEKIRENEILKKQMAEEKRNRFKDSNHSKSFPIPSSKELPKRRKLLDNPILNKFEAQAKLPEAEEAIRKAQIESKRRTKPFQLIKDKIKNTSRINLDKLRRSRKTLGSCLSKEKLRTVVKTSRDQLNQEVTFAQDDDHNLRKTDMKNYLLSQVLYDGQAEVKAASKCHTIPETPTSKSREQSQNQREIERRRKEFELYKQEMEKYLSLFENSSEGDQFQGNKASKEDSSLAKKPIHNIGNIKELFESRNGPQQATAAKDVPKNAVGKLDTQAIFAFQEERPKPPTKMDYVPVVIDKEAFERTMNKFEMYKQEEELREERVKAIQARRKLKEAQLGEAQEMSEDEMETESDEENDPGLTSSDDDEMEKEEHANDQKISREWTLKQKVVQELQNLKDLDEKLMNRSAKENRRRQVLRQVQSEIESITRPVKSSSANDKEEDDTPQWIRMIMEMAPRQNLDRMEDLVQDDIQSEMSQDQGFEVEGKKMEKFVSFEESVNALMSLIDDEDELSSRKKSSQTSPRRPQKLNMEDFSFESATQNDSKPKSTVACKANIKEVKEQLLRKNSNAIASKANDQAKGFLGRACNDIKRSLTRRNQETKRSTPPRRLQRRKSIIQLPEFEANPSEAKHSQPKKIWSYQNRTMKELYDLVNHRSDDVSSGIATKAEHIMEQSKTLEQAKSDLSHAHDQPVMLYDEFLSNVENYLEKTKANSVKNSLFNDNLQAYLDLIQDANNHEKESKFPSTPGICIPYECNGSSIRRENMLKPFEGSQTQEPHKRKQVGKLSEEQLNVIKQFGR